MMHPARLMMLGHGSQSLPTALSSAASKTPVTYRSLLSKRALSKAGTMMDTTPIHTEVSEALSNLHGSKMCSCIASVGQRELATCDIQRLAATVPWQQLAPKAPGARSFLDQSLLNRGRLCQHPSAVMARHVAESTVRKPKCVS